MSLKPFWCYYGGKWRAAPKYPAPAYGVIIEPFAGAAGYSLRYPHYDVRLYDVDPLICAVWEYLICTPEKEIRRLPLEVTHVDELKCCQEAKWLIGFWLNKGCPVPKKSPSLWMRAGSHVTSFWGDRIRERIAGQVGKIRHWTIENKSYEDIEDCVATWFVDPPYNNKAGQGYRFSEINYGDLGEWCKARSGRVIVCENAGADWLPFKHFAYIKSMESCRGKHKSSEVIWAKGCYSV